MTLKYSKLLEAQRKIGTFINYAIATAAKYRQEKHLKTINHHLKQLMFFEKLDVDLITLVKLLGLNDLSAIEFLESYEIDKSTLKSCLSIMQNRWKSMTDSKKRTIDVWRSKKSNKPLELRNILPCLDNGTIPECKEYCDWKEKFHEDWNLEDSFTLQRFVCHIC